MDVDPAVKVFIEECTELLQDMEEQLLKLEDNPNQPELIAAVFRAIHTIKGTGGIFAFKQVVEFTHEVEFILDNVRKGETELTKTLLSNLFPCCDHVAKLVSLAVDDLPLDQDTRRHGNSLLKAFGVEVAEPSAEQGGEVQQAEHNAADWTISVKFGEDVLKDGMDPKSFLHYLQEKGDISQFELITSALPEAQAFDPESCYLSYAMKYHTSVSEQEINDVFEFVMEESEVEILPLEADRDRYTRLINTVRHDDKLLCDELLAQDTLSYQVLNDFLEDYIEHRQQVGEMIGALDKQRLVSEEVCNKLLEALHKRQKASAAAPREESLRVDAAKLDTLINLVGELVTATANAHLIARENSADNMLDSVDALIELVEDIRDCSLRLRMVPIGNTFSRFRRVVRDLGNELGKEIQLNVSGEDTELDKSVIEKLGDPLMHMVRNAIDHGLEIPEQRLAAGKAAKGEVSLNAYHETGSIVIEISDDGAGLNRDKIYQKALERELIQQGAELSDKEIYQLIFLPGFSTADQVSNISGRGVGMDVVLSNIKALRGTVDVDSQMGKGSTMIIRVPLTLAIIEGFLVRVGQCNYVLPLNNIYECVEQPAEQLANREQAGYTSLRGEVLPFLRLKTLFGEMPDGDCRESLVVVQFAGEKAGILVDELLGEFQTVIKPLGKLFQDLSWVTGSTIMGNGEVALILDVAGLVRLVKTTLLRPGDKTG